MRLRNDRIIMNVPGATTKVATLKQALSEAENKAAKERTEREKQEVRVGAVQHELQAIVKKHETLELDSKTRESKLAAALESTTCQGRSPKGPPGNSGGQEDSGA